MRYSRCLTSLSTFAKTWSSHRTIVKYVQNTVMINRHYLHFYCTLTALGILLSGSCRRFRGVNMLGKPLDDNRHGESTRFVKGCYWRGDVPTLTSRVVSVAAGIHFHNSRWGRHISFICSMRNTNLSSCLRKRLYSIVIKNVSNRTCVSCGVFIWYLDFLWI